MPALMLLYGALHTAAGPAVPRLVNADTSCEGRKAQRVSQGCMPMRKKVLSHDGHKSSQLQHSVLPCTEAAQSASNQK